MGEGKAKSTVREALEAMAAQGDPESMAELAALPELPPLGEHLWRWFAELSALRTSTGMGPSRITRAEIRAWEADEGHALELWERRALIAIDAAWFSSAATPDKDKGGQA